MCRQVLASDESDGGLSHDHFEVLGCLMKGQLHASLFTQDEKNRLGLALQP